MSHFECRLNQRFWRSKKVVQVVQIGVRGGGGEVIWTKSKRTAAFFRETFPKLTNFQRTEKYSIAMFSLLDILLLMQGMLGEREDWEDNLMRAEGG